MSAANAADEQEKSVKTIDRHPSLRRLYRGATVKVSPTVVNVFKPYMNKVATLVDTHRLKRDMSPFYVYVLHFITVTLDAQDTLAKLLKRAYKTTMDYVINVAAAGQLLLIKGMHLDPAGEGAALSDIVYVMLEKETLPTKCKSAPASCHHVRM